MSEDRKDLVDLKFSHVEDAIDEIKQLHLDEHKESREERVQINKRLKKIEDQLSLYALTIKLFKGSCYIALIIVGLKAGDIGEHWAEIFK